MANNETMRASKLGPAGLNTRRKLLDSLRDLLDVEPLHHLTIKNVAWEANVSSTTFYCYFSDIDEAIQALVPEVWSTHEDAPLWEVQVRNAIDVHHLTELRKSKIKGKSKGKGKGKGGKR